jgi:hypothetical protein
LAVFSYAIAPTLCAPPVHDHVHMLCALQRPTTTGIQTTYPPFMIGFCFHDPTSSPSSRSSCWCPPLQEFFFESIEILDHFFVFVSPRRRFREAVGEVLITKKKIEMSGISDLGVPRRPVCLIQFEKLVDRGRLQSLLKKV